MDGKWNGGKFFGEKQNSVDCFCESYKLQVEVCVVGYMKFGGMVVVEEIGFSSGLELKIENVCFSTFLNIYLQLRMIFVASTKRRVI